MDPSSHENNIIRKDKRRGWSFILYGTLLFFVALAIPLPPTTDTSQRIGTMIGQYLFFPALLWFGGYYYLSGRHARRLNRKRKN